MLGSPLTLALRFQIVFFLLALSIAAAVLCGFWEHITGRDFTMYLPWDASVIPDVEQKGTKQVAIISTLIFFSYVMLLNTLVPISLYVRYVKCFFWSLLFNKFVLDTNQQKRVHPGNPIRLSSWALRTRLWWSASLLMFRNHLFCDLHI